MQSERLLPHDIEAEEAVIASILVDDEAIHKVAPILRPDDFFREKNAWTYEVCLSGTATRLSTRSLSATSWPAASAWSR